LIPLRIKNGIEIDSTNNYGGVMQLLKIEANMRISNVECTSLDDLQMHVGGLIQYVDLQFCNLIANEDGLLSDFPSVNHIATIICSNVYKPYMPIVGDVLIAGKTDDEGKTASFNDEIKEQLIKLVPALQIILRKY
jgi:hypothetical protein